MIIVKQKHVRKIPSAIRTSGAACSQLIVPAKGEYQQLDHYALSNLNKVGDRVIPTMRRAATKRNVEGRVIVHRDQEKEAHHWYLLWGRNQFCGRGETEWVEDWIRRTGFRYPRTQLPPENVEISLIENTKGERFYVVDVIGHGSEERWTSAANIMLEIFGFFWAIEPGQIELPLTVTRRVNWRILPSGKYPWATVKPQIDRVIGSLKNKIHRKHAKRSLQEIARRNPAQTLIGEGGFHGYVAFCFDGSGRAPDFAVLESIHPNNATYILGVDWEMISKLSKGEILADDLHLTRLIHGQSWQDELGRWFQAYAA